MSPLKHAHIYAQVRAADQSVGAPLGAMQSQSYESQDHAH
jgi:hypothetical protein